MNLLLFRLIKKKNKYLSLDGSKDNWNFTIKFREDPIILDPRNKELRSKINNQS